MRRLLMREKAWAVLLMFVLGVLPTDGNAAAEEPDKPEKVDLLFVQNANGASVDLKTHTLTLLGVSQTTVFFSDRPVRIAGHYTTEEFLKLWGEGRDSFLANPPNATLSVFEKGRADLVDLVVTLKNPRLKGNDLTYDITVIEGSAPKGAGPTSLFIDFLLMPWRLERRAVMYGAAMTSVAAAQAIETGPPAQYGGPPPQYGGPPSQYGNPPPGPPAGQATPEEKLLELKSLYNQGLISQSEYEAKKQEVLNQLVQ